MNDELHLLASAYLDDALNSDERARAEADPDVMATVARLREIRHALSEVEPPDPARRETAIDTALKTFTDELGVAPPPVAALARRRAHVWLAGAAAAAALVLVVAGGILVAQRGQGDDDTADGGAATAGTAQVLSRDEARTAASTVSPAAAPDASPGAEDARGTTTQAEQGQARTSASTNGAPAPAATSLAPPLLTSPADLTAYAAQPRSELLDLAAGSTRTCRGGRWLGPATYLVDGVDTPVQVFLVANAGQVRAIDSATCAVVATAPAP